MGERKQKGFLTVTLIAVTDCHISSLSLDLLNTKIQIKNFHTRLVRCIYFPALIGLFFYARAHSAAFSHDEKICFTKSLQFVQQKGE